MEVFSRFKDLFLLEESRSNNITLSRGWHTKLEKEALTWFFKQLDKCESEYLGDKLMFTVKGMPTGFYANIIMMMHFEHWGVDAWRCGFNAGRMPGKNYVENIYPNERFFDHSAWFLGYGQGLHNFRFFPVEPPLTEKELIKLVFSQEPE